MTLKPIQGPVAPVSAMAVAMNSRRARLERVGGLRAGSRAGRSARWPPSRGRPRRRPRPRGRRRRGRAAGRAGGDLAGHRVPPLEAPARSDAASAPSISIAMSIMSASPYAPRRSRLHRYPLQAAVTTTSRTAARPSSRTTRNASASGGLDLLGALDARGVRPAGGGGDAGIVGRRVEGDVEVGGAAGVAVGMDGERREARRLPAAVVEDDLQEGRAVARAPSSARSRAPRTCRTRRRSSPPRCCRARRAWRRSPRRRSSRASRRREAKIEPGRVIARWS